MLEPRLSPTQFVTKYYRVLLVFILAWTFFTRAWRLEQPKSYVFDEVYHAVTSKLIARNDVRAFEWWNPDPEPNTAVDWLHPPLAKYTQALSILLLGENSLGWRFSSVIFGVLVVYITARLGEELFSSKTVGLLSAWLVSLDGLVFAQSRIAMNDIHVTFFILLTLYYYLKHLKLRHNTTRYLWLTGLSAGLAMGSKWSGLFVLMIVIIIEALYQIKGLTTSFAQTTKELLGKKGLALLGAFILLPLGIYIASYSLMFLQGKSLICRQEREMRGTCYFEQFYWPATPDRSPNATLVYEGYVSHFIELHRQIWWYQTTLVATHPFQSRPIQWFLNTRPVWFAVEYSEGKQADIYNVGNTALFWLSDIAIVFTLLVLAKYMCRDQNKPHILEEAETKSKLSLLLFSYLMVWLPWQFSPRIMFFYHYTPGVPLMTILLSYWLVRCWRHSELGRVIASSSVVAIFLVFLVWYPHWTHMMMPTKFKEAVYFALESWR